MRQFLAALLLFSVTGAFSPAADPPKDDIDALKRNASIDQQRVQQQFTAFRQALLSLAQRLEKSNKAEDREKAAVLRQAIELAAKEGVDHQFHKLVSTLTNQGVTLRDIESAIGQNEQLTKTLREMIALLLTDNQTAKLKEEQKRLQELLKQLDKVIREQKVERSKVESGRGDPDALARGQNKVTQNTESLNKAMGGKQNASDGKGDPKGEGKTEDKAGDPKNDTKDAKGDPRSKPNKDGESKSGGKANPEAKGDGPKDEDTKPKGGPPSDKPTDPNDAKGQPDGKGDEKPGEGSGEPKSGPPQQSPPKAGQPSQGQPGDGKSESQQQPEQQSNQEQTPGKKQIQDAIENQKRAEEEIRKEQRKPASAEQDEAIKKLEEVRKEIERRLKQLREEELERLLANLEARVSRMLAMQTEVYEGTKRLNTTILANEGQKSTRTDDLKSGEMSVREGAIVQEAQKALQLLEEEGSAVAFPMVLEDARDQMKAVQARLFKTDVSLFTQSIEESIIATLKEMLLALKKAQQDLKDKKNQPPPPPGGMPQNQKLIDMLAELKMIRQLQMNVNGRTKTYGKAYPGEQTDDPDIQKELRDLSKTQTKIQRVTKDIATGKTSGQ